MQIAAARALAREAPSAPLAGALTPAVAPLQKKKKKSGAASDHADSGTPSGSSSAAGSQTQASKKQQAKKWVDGSLEPLPQAAAGSTDGSGG